MILKRGCVEQEMSLISILALQSRFWRLTIDHSTIFFKPCSACATYRYLKQSADRGYSYKLLQQYRVCNQFSMNQRPFNGSEITWRFRQITRTIWYEKSRKFHLLLKFITCYNLQKENLQDFYLVNKYIIKLSILTNFIPKTYTMLHLMFYIRCQKKISE